MSSVIEKLIKDGELRGEMRGEQRGKQIGEEWGRRKGEDRVFALIRCLVQDGRLQLITEMAEDSLLREKLYRQYRV